MAVLKHRYRLLKLVIAGSLLTAVLPTTLQWSQVYAATSTGALKTPGEIQQKLIAGLTLRNHIITFKYKGSTDKLKSVLDKALQAALESDPYTMYILDRYSFQWQGTSMSVNVTVDLTYRETKEQTDYVDSQVKSILKELIKPGMNDHEKVKVIHDWVVLHLKYDESMDYYTAYEGLKTGRAVCQGYSLLTYKMLKSAGITNIIVEGQAGGQLHAWNLVLLGGKWYHLDTTWDDPLPDQGEVHTAYYLRTDVQMKKDHSWTKTYPPAVTLYRETLSALIWQDQSKSAFYTKLEKQLGYNFYLESEIVSTSAQLNEKVTAAVKAGDRKLTFRYDGSKSSLEQDLQKLYNLGLNQIKYSMSPFEDTGDWMVEIEWTK
ncbi:transglutaminase domain-containing protein [Paenibacillus sediminis]|uniref:Transglutaminase-like domain-containing protein n=1 Tax=Paenibacillus sediminis TaxID=664909 RepID=A0ABS4H3M7_9BACL|nr:transglutaminase domain-containing protein [Paenibacillus sediminis]MBP1937134.1 hypothetical protein [Paenibacillus sediminis]